MAIFLEDAREMVGEGDYMFGYSDEEHRRLVAQSALFGELTEDLFRRAGLRPGMRVLDVGAGAGDVSILAARLVGETGTVLGIDRAAESVARAQERVRRLGPTNITFRQDDLTQLQLDHQVDACVGRLILMYLPDRERTVKHLLTCVRPGGVVAFQEMDMDMGRAVPQAPVLQQARSWIPRVVMNRMFARAAAALVWSSFFSLVLAAEDWTRFRGPNGSGVSTATNLPVVFGPTQNVLWKTPLPPGHSSPVMTDTRIFLTAHTPERDTYKLLVIALDRKTGRLLWQKEVPRLHAGRRENVNGAASPSPVTDGSRVYAFFQEFGLIAFTADGDERWRMPLGPFNMFYGFGASPILVDGTLVLSVDQDAGAYLLAVDPATGRQRWKADKPHVISGYSTPTVFRPAGGPVQLVIPESFQLTAYSLADGKKLWWVRGLACEMKSVASTDGQTLFINGWGFSQNQAGQQIPTITFAEGLARFDKNGDGFVGRDEITGTERMDRMLRPEVGYDAFDLNRDKQLSAPEWDVFRAMLASENGLLAIRMGGQGDMTEQAIRWKYLRPVPQVPSTLLYQGVLFMVNDSGILISFDPETGTMLKQGRLKGAIDKYFASPVGADGKVWLVSQDGTVSVVSARGEWEILAVNALDDEVFATPVPADGQLFVRTRSALYAFAR